MNFDYVIVGSGIVGLGTAYQLRSLHPQARIAVVDKESGPGQHQTSHNSGVLHSGIYYKPGSLKAQLSRRGLQLMVNFCAQHQIAHEICGKVIVAVEEKEITPLKALAERARQNGLKEAKWLEASEVQNYEPHVKAEAGLWIPETGIVDYLQVSQKLVEILREKEVHFQFGFEVKDILEGESQITLKSASSEITSRKVVFCAGLQSDRLLQKSTASSEKVDFRIVPFRGEYYKVQKSQEGIIRSLVYPVPNPELPFLGVHLTRMIHGGVEAGPNAVLSLKRECYAEYGVDLWDALDTFTWPGFYQVAWKYLGVGAEEVWRTLSRRAFCRAVQRLTPDLKEENLEFAFAGVRAQAVSRRGQLLDDFVIVTKGSRVHICNAPSPAATSSLAIGEYIANRI